MKITNQVKDFWKLLNLVIKKQAGMSFSWGAPYLYISLDNEKTADVRTINSPQAIKRCFDQDSLISIMKANGINAGLEDVAGFKSMKFWSSI